MFVYGTLMNRDTRDDVVGNPKDTYNNELNGYRRVGLDVVEEEGSVVSGMTFEVNEIELARLDIYEGVAHNLYRRKQVELADGSIAWVYQKCDPRSQVYAPGAIG